MLFLHSPVKLWSQDTKCLLLSSMLCVPAFASMGQPLIPCLIRTCKTTQLPAGTRIQWCCHIGCYAAASRRVTLQAVPASIRAVDRQTGRGRAVLALGAGHWHGLAGVCAGIFCWDCVVSFWLVMCLVSPLYVSVQTRLLATVVLQTHFWLAHCALFCRGVLCNT